MSEDKDNYDTAKAMFMRPMTQLALRGEKKPEDTAQVLPTGWASVDKMLEGGFRKGELVVLSSPYGGQQIEFNPPRRFHGLLEFKGRIHIPLELNPVALAARFQAQKGHEGELTNVEFSSFDVINGLSSEK